MTANPFVHSLQTIQPWHRLWTLTSIHSEYEWGLWTNDPDSENSCQIYNDRCEYSDFFLGWNDQHSLLTTFNSAHQSLPLEIEHHMIYFTKLPQAKIDSDSEFPLYSSYCPSSPNWLPSLPSYSRWQISKQNSPKIWPTIHSMHANRLYEVKENIETKGSLQTTCPHLWKLKMRSKLLLATTLLSSCPSLHLNLELPMSLGIWTWIW